MVAFGFDPVGALRTITALSNYVGGFILQEQSAPQPATQGSVTRQEIRSNEA
ncbi:MAG TPA: hypothetical protein VKT82_16640 [Ktedonobacterales bacterium]|nr:hypothetical protein [Ktedonobacterales bacterium]